jgi:uncharacterized protein (TIGR03067 family)
MRQAIRISISVIVCLIMTALCSMALAAEQDLNKKDLNAMQGTWIIQKWISDGIAAPVNMIPSNVFTLVIKGDQMTMVIIKDDPVTIKLNSASDPPSIDFIDKDKLVDRGIYQFKDGTLTFCIATSGSGQARPTVFESTDDNLFMLVVLKRQMPK